MDDLNSQLLPDVEQHPEADEAPLLVASASCATRGAFWGEAWDGDPWTVRV
jgi:hypothetical protein